MTPRRTKYDDQEHEQQKGPQASARLFSAQRRPARRPQWPPRPLLATRRLCRREARLPHAPRGRRPARLRIRATGGNSERRSHISVDRLGNRSACGLGGHDATPGRVGTVPDVVTFTHGLVWGNRPSQWGNDQLRLIPRGVSRDVGEGRGREETRAPVFFTRATRS